MSSSPERLRPFFVGYLPIPKTLRGFAAFLSLALGLVGMLIAVGLSHGQNAPRTGVFEFGRESSLEGTIAVTPAPMLWTRSESGVATPVLLVGQWKFGADDVVSAFDGASVEIRGTRIMDGDMQLFEVAGSTDAVRPSPSPAPSAPTPEWTGGEHSVLRGEIIDPKCFFGVMKPGYGKVHKGCATRCISGGIPPMLWVRHATSHESFYLLVGPDDTPARDLSLPFIAEPVEIQGRVQTVEGAPFSIMRISDNAIRRIR